MPLGAYRIAAVGAQVGIGVAGSVNLSVGAVGKGNGPNAEYCIANELICGEIGRFLRLPIPPGGIVTSAHHPALYASLDFNLAGVALPPVNPAQCFNLLPRPATGLLLFDILIANSDRHAGNLSLNTAINPPQMNIFDHSHALLGHQHGLGEQRVHALAGHLAVTGGPWTGGNRHCLLDVVSVDQHFSLWIDRITALPDFLIEEICEDARPFGITAAESLAVQTFLKDRRNTFTALIQNHQADFPAIQNWSII